MKIRYYNMRKFWAVTLSFLTFTTFSSSVAFGMRNNDDKDKDKEFLKKSLASFSPKTDKEFKENGGIIKEGQNVHLDPKYALYTMGNSYEIGNKTTAKNISKAIEYYKSSAELKNEKAYGALGVIYLKGNGVKQNISQAIEYFKSAVNLGDKISCLHLAFIYENGKNFKKDINLAKEYLDKVNDGDIYLRVGAQYYDGNGAPIHIPTALQYLKKAAELGQKGAFFLLGTHCEIEKDYNQGVPYMEKAVELEQENALAHLMRLYMGRLQTNECFNNINLQYVEKAKEQKLPCAFELWVGYLFSQSNHAKTIPSLEEKVELNDENALGLLMEAYAYTLQQNYNKLNFSYVEKAAEKGEDPYARQILGNFYYNKQWVPQNLGKALEWFEWLENFEKEEKKTENLIGAECVKRATIEKNVPYESRFYSFLWDNIPEKEYKIKHY